jgi:hypothetical protein
MNLLIDKLPTSIDVDGKLCFINTDFRPCIRIMLAFEDEELTDYEKQLIMLANLYNEIPDNAQAAVEKAGWFLNGGEEMNLGEQPPNLRLCSFEKDANFIFSAFRQTHGIDLETIQLHWWKFLALFMDLGSDTTFCNLVGLRKRVKTGKASKEEKATFRELGDLADLKQPETRSLEDRIAEEQFMKQVQGAGNGRT